MREINEIPVLALLGGACFKRGGFSIGKLIGGPGSFVRSALSFSEVAFSEIWEGN